MNPNVRYPGEPFGDYKMRQQLLHKMERDERRNPKILWNKSIQVPGPVLGTVVTKGVPYEWLKHGPL